MWYASKYKLFYTRMLKKKKKKKYNKHFDVEQRKNSNNRICHVISQSKFQFGFTVLTVDLIFGR